MSEQPSPPARRRTLRKVLLLFFGTIALAIVLFGWYATTESFQQWMRHRVVAELEKATGGRVELGELHTIPFRWRIDARNLTIHGREGADQAPLLQIDRTQAELEVISVLSTTIGLHSLEVEHPVVHIINYPDGTTNIPGPKRETASQRGPVDELISLAISRVEVDKGELLWENQTIPFSFAGRDVGLRLDYAFLRRQYDVQAKVGSVTTHWQQWPEIVWSADSTLVLSRGRADIKSLNAKSGKSELHFVGQVQDFRDPHISGEYRGVADLAVLAPILREGRLRKGIADFAGKGTWNLRDFSTQANVQAKDVEWVQGKFSARNGRVEGNVTLTPARLHVTGMKANLLGGSLTGEVDVTNWQTSPETPAARGTGAGRITAENTQRGIVRLQLAGFPLGPIMAPLSSKEFPLDRLNLVGNASGTTDILWTGSLRDAETKAALVVTPPARVEANDIPVRGQIDGVYRGAKDELDLNALHLTTPGSEINASGSLAPGATLKFSVVSHNVKEWTPLLTAAWGKPKLPFTVHGWSNFNGSASGKLGNVSLSGNLEAYDFETEMPATSRGPAQSVHWDALSTALQFSNSSFAAHNGSLIHGRTVAHFDLTSGLKDGVLADDSPFTLHLDFLGADLAEAGQLARISMPLRGSLGLSLNASGMRSAPHGEGHFEVRDGSAYDVSVAALSGDLKLSNGELQFNNVVGRSYDAQIAGKAIVHTNSHEFRVDLKGTGLDLGHFPRLQSGRFRLEGIADFAANASGTLERPSVEGHARVKGLALNGERQGDFLVDAVTQGRVLTLNARSEFEKSDLTASGTITLENDYPADLKMDFHQLDIVPLLSVYLPGKLTGRSPVDGTIQVRGPLRSPRDLKASAEIRSFSAQVEHVQIANAEPIRFEIVDQTVLIKSFHVAGSGTDFTAHGRAHLTGAREIDMGLDGSVNMTLLDSLNPKILARGTLDVNLSASGTWKDPEFQGRLDVKNTSISHNDFPSGLSDLNGVLLFDRNRIEIQNLSGTTGGGTIALTGSARYQSGVVTLDLGATAQGVRMRYPPGVSSTANADLRLTGTTNAAVLSGDVLVTKLAVTPGFDFGAYIERSKQSVTFAQTDSLASRLRLDVHVATTPELQMQTAIARLSGNADLRLRGTAERPVVLGRVEVLEGDISFNGTRYRLERGDVTFTNPAKTQPIIDLQAGTRVRDYDITVRFRGDASVSNGLKVTWQSEPQLPEADVIALLALGRTREEAASGPSNGTFGFGGEASNLLINEALNTAVSSRVQRLFGVSRIKIDPQGLANETNVVRGPQLTIEQQVASNLTVTYSTNVSVSTQQIIQVEYNITRNISIVALRDQNGVVSFDFKIRQRKK